MRYAVTILDFIVQLFLDSIIGFNPEIFVLHLIQPFQAHLMRRTMPTIPISDETGTVINTSAAAIRDEGWPTFSLA
jgi:hypothetical protein